MPGGPSEWLSLYLKNHHPILQQLKKEGLILREKIYERKFHAESPAWDVQSFCAVLGVTEENERLRGAGPGDGRPGKADLWEGVFRDLGERGLNLEKVELGIMDGLPGLEQTFKRFFPRAQTQRCQKHAKANACRRVRKKERDLFSKALHTVFYAPTESEARAAFFKVKEQWGRLFPSAVQVIEKDLIRCSPSSSSMPRIGRCCGPPIPSSA